MVEEMREEQIKKMVAEGKISPEEGRKLLDALDRSRSGEAERAAARKAGKREQGRGRFLLVAAVAVAVLAAAGLGLGLYFGLRGGESANDLFEKGEAAFSEGNFEQAVEYYQEGIEKEPSSSVGYNLLGMAYRFLYNQTGDDSYREDEIGAFEKSIELDPRNPVPLVNLGATLYYSGHKQEAANYLNKSLEIYPDHPDRAGIEKMIEDAGQSNGGGSGT
jgi:tetratricopeptide (TPR) repeat protein